MVSENRLCFVELQGILLSEQSKKYTRTILSVVGVLIDGHITLLYVSEEGLGCVELQGLYVRLIT